MTEVTAKLLRNRLDTNESIVQQRLFHADSAMNASVMSVTPGVAVNGFTAGKLAVRLHSQYIHLYA